MNLIFHLQENKQQKDLLELFSAKFMKCLFKHLFMVVAYYKKAFILK